MTTIKRSIKDFRRTNQPYHVLEFEDEQIGLKYNRKYMFATWLHVLKDGQSTLCAVFDICGMCIQIFEKDGSMFACFAENNEPLCFPSPYNNDLSIRQFHKEVVVRVFAYY